MRRTVTFIAALALFISLPLPGYAIEPKYEVSEAYAGSVYHERLLAVEPSGSRVADILNIALSQLGYHEGEEGDYAGGDSVGNSNYTEYGYAFPFDGAEWCAMFVTWCAQQAGISREVIGHSSLANPRYFRLAYYDPGYFSPKAGDLVFFGKGNVWGHVAMVLAATEGRIYTVEGNKNDAVRICSYRRDNPNIRAYSAWTGETCPLEATGISRFYALEFSPNGGVGEMEAVCCSDLSPAALYKNEVILSDYTGEPLYDHYMYRVGLTFAGWYVRRDGDGAWLTEQGFLQSEEIATQNVERTILPDGAEVSADNGWSEEKFPTFTLHAVWEDENGGRDHDVSAYIPIADKTGWVNAYCDLKAEQWYYAAARSCVQKGLMEGTAESFFSPEGTLTRAEAVTLLHRLSGSPAAESECGFSDVQRDKWYTAAVDWAVESGVVDGFSEHTFAPGEPVTKFQFLVMLCRLDGRVSAGERSEGIPGWVAGAVAWAKEKVLYTEEIAALPGGDPIIRGACAYLVNKL